MIQRQLVTCRLTLLDSIHAIQYLVPNLTPPYLLLKYHVKANCWISCGKGVGTSVNPGLATGSLKYTAEQIL